MRILGAWYTHNQIDQGIIQASLRSLSRAWDRSAKDVEICCAVWDPIPDNPHRELIQFHRVRSHLGIALQIARILWEYGKQPPDAVCFLEHDVLYPEDYFQRTAEAFAANPDAPGVFNQDYVGLNETGWLETQSRLQPPLHQLSMRWDYATAWLDWRIRECVCNQRQGLEPEDKSEFAIIPPGGNPSVHINHRRHFTSHYKCFARQGVPVHPYWGEFANYYPEGEGDARG